MKEKILDLRTTKKRVIERKEKKRLHRRVGQSVTSGSHPSLSKGEKTGKIRLTGKVANT